MNNVLNNPSVESKSANPRGVLLPVTNFLRQGWRGNIRTKLIAAFLATSIIPLVVLTFFNNRSAQNLLEEEALHTMIGYNKTYESIIAAESKSAEALAMSIADREDVQQTYLAGNRSDLYELLAPLFGQWKERQIVHLYIENPDGTVFLRVHAPEKFGDDVTYRETANTAMTNKTVTSGVEIGPSRLGVRGVAPMYSPAGEFIGMTEVGLDFDEDFVSTLKQEIGADFTMWVSYDAASIPALKPVEGAPAAPIEELFFYTSTLSDSIQTNPEVYRSVLETGEPVFQILTTANPPAVVYITPLLGYNNKVLGLLQISEPYTAILAARNNASVATLLLAAFLLLLTAIAVNMLSNRLVIKPVSALNTFANKQAHGETEARVSMKSGDEFELLANTFNSMADTVEEERQTLETRVAERTLNLELATEVGRTVSQVRALDVMLTEAAELIRSQFDLYYVQVYLVNPSKTYLNLKAGTGNIGQELLARQHRLPLNADSINGRAAVEKKSVVISDTQTSTVFKPNPLLPNTRSEVAVPLMIGDRVVGVLDMQSEYSGLLDDVLSAFEALAGQLAIAVQNSNLLAETEQARAEVEKQARRLVRTSWNEHLDAIHKPEQIGYVYTQDAIAPLAEAEETQSNNAVSSPISVTGEKLGSLTVEIDDTSSKEQTEGLVMVVARQVAQQIENLRLLESAERYRLEAEEASRRMTREAWKSYAENTDESLSYVYDLQEVHPQDDAQGQPADGYTVPLKVREETIGKLMVQGLQDNDAESVTLANTIAERLASHIEGLRLFNQSESALAQSERLFEASRRLTESTGLQELVEGAVTALNIPEVNRALLTSFNYDENGELMRLDVIANWWNGTGNEATPVGTRYPLEVIRVMPMFVSPVPVFFNDAFHDERVDATTMALVQRLNLRAVAVLPLHAGSRQIGALILEAEQPHNFSQEETRLFAALAPQIAVTTENYRQFESAQRQAEREAMLNVINQKIQSATSVEAVLQIAARELGHALGAPMTIAQLSMKDRAS